MSLKNYTVGCSALGGEIYLYQKSLKPGVALDKRPAEAEVMAAVIEHMMHGSPKGAIKKVSFGDQRFEITVKPI